MTTVEYRHPRVFIDGEDVGDLVTMLQNQPQREAAILSAVDVAWTSYQGQVDEQATESAIESAALEVEALRQENASLLTEIEKLQAQLAPPEEDWQGLSRGFKSSSLGKSAKVLSLTNLPVNTHLTFLKSAIFDQDKAELLEEYAALLQAMAEAGSPVSQADIDEVWQIFQAAGFTN